jgi:ribonuclease HI
LTPIDLKIKETAHLYQLTRGSRREEARFDQDMGIKHWLHPAIKLPIAQEIPHSALQIFTDGSKSDQEVGVGITVYELGTHTECLKYRLNNKCTNNQAEQLVILKSLEYIGNTRTTDRTVTIHTDSQTTIDSLLNNNTHAYLIDNIRRKVTELTQAEWKIQICWVKAHAGLQGNELADTLANSSDGLRYSRVLHTDSEKRSENRSRGQKLRQIAERQESNHQWTDYQRLFPVSGWENKTSGNKYNPQIYNHDYRTPRHKRLSTPLQDFQLTDLRMQGSRPNNTPSTP